MPGNGLDLGTHPLQIPLGKGLGAILHWAIGAGHVITRIHTSLVSLDDLLVTE